MARRLRLSVVQLVPALHAGGVERGTLEIGEALVAAGHRSIVISAGGKMVADLEAAGSEHHRWPIRAKTPLALALVPRLRRFLREVDADIVHARSRLPAWVGYLAWRGMPPDSRGRFVTTAHGVYSVGRYSRIMARGERVIAVSRAVREHLLEAFPGTDPARVQVIHRGVDARAFPRGHRPAPDWLTRWREAHPGLAGRFVVTLAGRLTRLKGHDTFLRLLVRLAAERPSVHGLVVGAEEPGGSRYATALREEARAAGVPVTFAGHRDDMADVYAVSDLVCSLSSHPESFGRTVLEALSIGVPVLGFAHGGVAEILAEAFPAGMVTPGDEEQLLASALAFHDRPPTVAPLAAFTLADMQASTLHLYEALAASRARAHEVRSGH